MAGPCVRLREELSALRQEQKPARPADEPEPPAPPASTAVAEQGQRLLDVAQSRGRWDEESAERLRRLLPEMTDAQRMEVLLRLNRSVNEGQLRVETRGSLF